MIHIFNQYKDLYVEEYYADCSCGFRVVGESKESLNDEIMKHLSDLKWKTQTLHRGKITSDLVESFMINGAKPPAFCDLSFGECVQCDRKDGESPMHVGSPLCREGGLGAKGKRAHCDCKACYGG